MELINEPHPKLMKGTYKSCCKDYCKDVCRKLGPPLIFIGINCMFFGIGYVVGYVVALQTDDDSSYSL